MARKGPRINWEYFILGTKWPTVKALLEDMRYNKKMSIETMALELSVSTWAMREKLTLEGIDLTRQDLKNK